MFLYSFLIPSIFLTTNPSYPLSSVLYPCLLGSIFLPPFCSYWSLYTSSVVCMYFIASFVFVSIPFSVSYQHSFFCTSLSIYILFSGQSSYYFCALLFICFSFLSFCFLFSLPLLTQFVRIRVFLFFFRLCQSLPLSPPTTHVSSRGNVSICFRKVPSSNLRQNTIMTEKKPSIFRVVDYANNQPLGCDRL